MTQPGDGAPAGASSDALGARGPQRQRGSVLSAARSSLGPACSFLVFTALSAWFLFRADVLYDTDSYYHLFIARVFRRFGSVDALPWLRMSLLRDGFGDKELLFHWLLVPFVGGSDSTLGGRAALALLNGALACALSLLGRRYAGKLGLLLPLAVYFGSLDFVGRMIRLRPEILALLLFLLAATLAVSRNYRLLGAVALVFALSYTAIHALVGLCGLWFLVRAARYRRWDWQLLLYPVMGAGIGLLMHPHFPYNLLIWKVQNVDFFRVMDRADVGREILTPSPWLLLRGNLGWLAALTALGTAVYLHGTNESRDGGSRDLWSRDVWLVAAIVFGILYVRMVRFSTYFIPFASVALLAAVSSQRRHGSKPPRWLGAVPWVALTVAMLLSLVPIQQLRGMALARGGALHREEDWAAAGQVIPPGGRVAMDWGLTPNMMFFAPQALYLNALDPLFMKLPFPKEYAAWREIAEGRAEDIPDLVTRVLDSEYLVLPLPANRVLIERLEQDPRVTRLYAGYTVVYKIEAAGIE